MAAPAQRFVDLQTTKPNWEVSFTTIENESLQAQLENLQDDVRQLKISDQGRDTRSHSRSRARSVA